MRRLVLALVASLGIVPASSVGAFGDVSGTEAILTCSDGHSAVLFADAATLTSLSADVASINSSGTGLSCALDTPTLDPSTQHGDWTVYDYNPAGRGIQPRRSPNSMPATSSGGMASFEFIPGTFTALLVTTSGAYTGDLSNKVLTDTVSWSNTGDFYDQHSGGCQPNLPKVRFYFTSPSGAGQSTGTPPAGFYTKFWWSDDPHSVVLKGDTSGGPLLMSVSTSDLTAWSDWNGKSAADPAVTGNFIEAVHNVQTIGLSYGGGCYFENGVSTLNQGPFSSDFSE